MNKGCPNTSFGCLSFTVWNVRNTKFLEETNPGPMGDLHGNLMPPVHIHRERIGPSVMQGDILYPVVKLLK